MGTRWVAPHTTTPLQNLKFIIEALTVVSQHTIQMVSTEYFLKLHLENGLHCENTGENVHSMENAGDEEPLLLGSSSQANQWPHPLKDLLQQTFYIHIGNTHTPITC